MSVHFSVKYKYRRTDSKVWTSTTFSGILVQQSETILMQKLREKHKGCEVELTEVKWR
jgi:hypothetical protein